jgi:hypothetical protein
MKRFLLATAALALTAGSSAARAQFFGSGIVFDPTQSAHAVEQISQGEQVFTNTVKIADNAIAAYNLAREMSMAPQMLYQSYISPSTYWMALNQAANTYGNSQLVVNSANTGANAAGAYQFASVPRTGVVPEYSSLTISGQQQIAAQGATTDLNDSIAESNLQMLGTMRANEVQREQDIQNLESATHSLDPTQQTDMATLQRINQALVLQLRQEQEANQLLQAVALQQMVTQKQEQDAMKAAAQDSADYGSNFQTQITPANNGAAQALTY